MLPAMIETATLAGFWAAHGIWRVSDGETLIPMLGDQRARCGSRLAPVQAAAVSRAYKPVPP